MNAAGANPFVTDQDVIEVIKDAQEVIGESIAAVEKFWSVTTVTRLGLPTGDGLIVAGRKIVAQTALDKRQIVEAMLRDEGREETVKWLATAPNREWGKARTRGTDLHAIIEKRHLGIDPGPIPEEQVPYIEQLARWEAKWQPEPIMAEAPVYNVTHKYAGTLDGIWLLRGKRVLVDFKTTDKGPDAPSRHPYEEVALQLSAYRYAEVVGVLADRRYADSRRYYVYDPTRRHEPMPEVDGAICVVVTPYDCFAKTIRTTPELFELFLDVMRASRWETGLKKQAFDGSVVLDALEPEG